MPAQRSSPYCQVRGRARTRVTKMVTEEARKELQAGQRDSKQALPGTTSQVLRAARAVADEQPFFCVVWFHAPHLPCVASEADRARYRAFDEATQHYFGCITAMDREVGRLRAALDDLGVSEQTMVWFCSDNGPEGKAGKAPGSSGGLRGRKRSLYESGTRVPAFAVWPGQIEAGARVETPACTSDSACISGWPSSRIVAVALVALSWSVWPGLILWASSTFRRSDVCSSRAAESSDGISDADGTVFSGRFNSTRRGEPSEVLPGESNISDSSRLRSISTPGAGAASVIENCLSVWRSSRSPRSARSMERFPGHSRLVNAVSSATAFGVVVDATALGWVASPRRSLSIS